MAGLLNGVRNDRHPNFPQHSSSMPSTPLQKPKRFGSRSPSPTRVSGAHSPRSVASEAIGNGAPLSRPPPLRTCVFETSEEIRKRRIPYVDKGDKELEAPEKEPKKTLEPDERDSLSGDMRELYDRLLPSPESEENRAKLVAKLTRILNEEWPESDLHVNVFGSSGNLLSSTDSDVDICLTSSSKKPDFMHSLAAVLHKHGMKKVVCRAAAKVPIVKCWDPELQLATDLNVNNTLALHNTRMIKTYVQLDDRVRPLAKIVKHWTKQRILNDASYGGTISSYTWICMVISFLQRREPPILPSLQKIEGHRSTPETDVQPSFADDVESLQGWGSANTESLGELLFQFFRHYGFEFDYSKDVISVKEGRLMSRQEKGWELTNYHDKEARCRLCVEEPFTVNRNLGNSADDYAWTGIHTEMRRAFDLLADGGQLEKCCEQYEFPPEEKTIFQRPVPKPKPTLTRSASQSGRPNHESGSTRSRKNNNRNASSQRAGSRRASSGATFSNQRAPFGFSPGFSHNPADYFGKQNLHETLSLQYQYLQAQTEVLKSQLAQIPQNHAQAQAQARSEASAAASPRHRAYANGLASLRFFDIPPQTAPLLPGTLYHYPARYPPPSPLSQARSREGTSTNPSSPSLMAAVPALRRQGHRAASVTETSPSSTRSQSQPGRSLPHPLTLQQHIYPGYDMSGALNAHYGGARTSQGFAPGVPGMPVAVPFMPFQQFQPGVPMVDNAIPKEYVGYYVGQSPQLMPQFPPANQMPPPMALRDPPLRQRRVTPDLMPPQMNGRHSSRSPSPLGHTRNFTTGDIWAATTEPQTSSKVTSNEFEESPPPLDRHISPLQFDGPVIVNGSNCLPPSQMSDSVLSAAADPAEVAASEDSLPSMTLPLRPAPELQAAEPLQTNGSVSPGSMTPASRSKPLHRLNLASEATPPQQNGGLEHTIEASHQAAPLLSPVAEQPTPSPTRTSAFAFQESPSLNGHISKVAKVANAWAVDRQGNGSPSALKHERKGSAPSATALAPKVSPTLNAPAEIVTSLTSSANGQARASVQNLDSSAAVDAANGWQQATRKGHKKSKSSVHMKGVNGVGGHAIPMHESERKGG